ncbi:MAG: hypothetical protein P4L49_10765 [Desulfosporosinus sp.]|nr:hypothetical protein [Desulfosporosinus sp.]
MKVAHCFNSALIGCDYAGKVIEVMDERQMNVTIRCGCSNA